MSDQCQDTLDQYDSYSAETELKVIRALLILAIIFSFLTSCVCPGRYYPGKRNINFGWVMFWSFLTTICTCVIAGIWIYAGCGT